MRIRHVGVTIVFVLMAFGCASIEPVSQTTDSIPPLPEISCQADRIEPMRALVEVNCVRSSIAFEEALNGREGFENDDWIRIVRGTTPVVVSAPHATRPLRNGRRRFSDGAGTAALAIAIGQLTDATIIHTIAEGPSDPNYYDDNAYKEQLGKLLESIQPSIVIDLHGSHPFRSYDVDLGTMRGASLLGNRELLDRLIESLEDEGFASLSFNRFGASKNETVTKYCAQRGIPAIQMEINANAVTPGSGNDYAQRFALMVQAIARFIIEMHPPDVSDESTD